MHDNDTIAALATPAGRGGVAVVRISGDRVVNIISEVTKVNLEHKVAKVTDFFDSKGVIDQGIAIYFKAPNSFTGEDVLEIQCHGGVVVVDLILNRLNELGARIALPGEFTQRAFLNNKIDLVQAEAIADLI